MLLDKNDERERRKNKDVIIQCEYLEIKMLNDIICVILHLYQYVTTLFSLIDL